MTLTGSTLNLQPANGSFGGLVSTSAQNFGGVKNFVNGTQFSSGTAILTNYSQASGNFTPTLNGGTLTSLTVRGVATGNCGYWIERIGNIVTLRIDQFTVAGATGTNAIITFTNLIPTGFRPSYNFQGLVMFEDNGAFPVNANYYFFINTSGTVQFLNGPSSFVTPFGLANDFQTCWTL
jgi:hypothetical protein